MKNFFQKSKEGLLILSLLMGGSFFFLSTDDNRYFEISKNMEIFANLYQSVNSNYVDEVDANQLMVNSIDAMLESLDPYTVFYSEAEVQNIRKAIIGTEHDIGIDVLKRDEEVVIRRVYQGTPAQEVGLKVGDVILKVGGESVANRTAEEVEEAVSGQLGSVVQLTVLPAGADKAVEHSLKCSKVTIPNVPYYGMVDEHTGYIVLSTFTENAGGNVAEAFKTLQEDHDVKQVIVDLRDNGGGLLIEAINLCNIFIDKGKEVVSTRNKIEDWDRSFKTPERAIDTEVPLIILINDGSASASEIVAGAIQDFDRGLLVGRKSFGKGLVQNHRDVGYNSRIKVTTARYYIPSGRCIQALEYKNGKPVEIADSLKRVFKTRGGRTVYDGGGLNPDHKVNVASETGVAKDLLERHFIFDYATQYVAKRDSIPPAIEFELGPEDFKNFLSYLKSRKYTYTAESEKTLDALREESEAGGYLASIDKHLSNMQAAILEDEHHDLRRHQAEILRLLEKEIAARYYYERGRVEAGLRRDKDVKAAVDLFNNKTQFNRLLSSY